MGDSSELKKEKKELREKILAERDAIPEENRETYSKAITQKILQLPEMKGSRHVLCYKSFGSEVETDHLIDACMREGKRVYLPRVMGKHSMNFYRYAGPDTLIQSRWGIWEPPEDESFLFDPGRALREGCIAIVPGTVFDRDGRRIGYGGGFYDRLFSDLPDLFACGIGFSCQITDRVPAGEFDVRMDIVVTDATEIVSHWHSMRAKEGRRIPYVSESL